MPYCATDSTFRKKPNHTIFAAVKTGVAAPASVRFALRDQMQRYRAGTYRSQHKMKCNDP